MQTRRIFAICTLSIVFPLAAKAGVTPWVEFEMYNGHIVIDAQIDGVPARAMIDSGAEGFAISENFLAAHGQHFKRGTRSDKVLVTGISGTMTKQPVMDVPVTLFGADFDLELAIPAGFGAYDLLIGDRFFSFSIVQIDYPQQRMRLVTRDAMDLKTFANVPVRRIGNSGTPMIKISLNEQTEQWLTLDTGSNGGLYLPRWMAEKNGWLEQYPTELAISVGVNGRPVRTEQFVLPRITLGPYAISDVLVRVPAEGEEFGFMGRRKGEPVRTSSRGLIGYDVLKHFVLTMDLKKKQLHVGLESS